MKQRFLLILIVLAPFIVCAQQSRSEVKKQERAARKKYLDAVAKKEEEGSIVFDKQDVFSIKLSTDGYGMFFEHARFKTINKNKLWWFELGERKDHKEKSGTINDPSGVPYGNSFIYGKINNFYYAKFGLGNQVPIGGKANKNGVAISAIYGGGGTLAMMKPYCLMVVDPNDPTNEIQIRYNQSALYDSLFLNPNTINGGAPFGSGFNKISFTPGVFARTAVRFDWEHFNTAITAVEVGLNAECYTQKLQIMANNPKDFFYFNAYVSIVLGGRKLR